MESPGWPNREVIECSVFSFAFADRATALQCARYPWVVVQTVYLGQVEADFAGSIVVLGWPSDWFVVQPHSFGPDDILGAQQRKTPSIADSIKHA